MKKAIYAIWRYIKSMNSESDGSGVSIKRNQSWVGAALLIMVEASTLWLVSGSLDKVIDLGKFYAVLDVIYILVVLGITSIEKIQSLANAMRPFAGGIQTPIANEKSPETNGD